MRPRAVAPGEIAWVLLLPCAVLTAVAVALLGPPLGHAFLAPGPERFWIESLVTPEPAEHGRYAVSLLGPPLLGAAALASPRWATTRGASLRRVAIVAQVALVAFLAVCLAGQENVLISGDRPDWWVPSRYFTLPTLLVALVLPAAVLALPRAQGAAARLASAVRETPTRRITCLVVAALFVVVWQLTAVDTDGSLANTATGVQGHILWSMDETFAILNGRTPFVNFHPEYGHLWPYVVAAVMAVIGTSIGVYTTVMVTASGLVLLAVFGVLRRVVRSSVLALALFLPFIANGFYMKLGPLDDRYGPANLFSLWPVRYGGPYLLAWLLSRHLDGAGPRRRAWLFAVSGLVVLNNPEFGVPALVATVVALVLVDPPPTARAWVRLAASAAGGLLGALTFVVALTLIRSGSLPRLGMLFEFSRLYGIDGWSMLPLPRIGIYLGVYVTFAAALVVAAVRKAQGVGEPVLTAMLAWIGAFGLLAGSYFVGRSHPQVLVDLFSPWTLALALLLVVSVRGLVEHGWRRPTLPELALLFGFGLAVCSLAQIPTPWSQIARIRDRAPTSIFRQRGADKFVARTSARGEKVAILIPLGHRIAYDTGRVNVSPYSSIESMPTHQQLAHTLAVLRAAHGNKLYLSMRFTLPDEMELVRKAGFRSVAKVWEPTGWQLVELIDRRGAHAH